MKFEEFKTKSNPESLKYSFDNPCICCDGVGGVPGIEFGSRRTSRVRRWYYEKNNILMQIIDCGDDCPFYKYRGEDPNTQKWPLVEVIHK